VGTTLPADAATGPDGSCGAPWVIFALSLSSASSELVARRADGSETQVLALPDMSPVYPFVSPDGTLLLYTTRYNSPYIGVYRFADRSVSHAATHPPPMGVGPIAGLSTSPDNALIAYNYGGTVLQLLGSDGSPADHVIVQEPQPSPGIFTLIGRPIFTSDSKILFASADVSASAVLQSVNVDGSNVVTLLMSMAMGSSNLQPTVPVLGLAPDSMHIAVPISCDGVSIDLRVYALASLPADCDSGSVVTSVIVSVGRGLTDPAWGPSGLIAYEAYDNGPSDILIVDATGGTPVDLTADLTAGYVQGFPVATSPTWAPGCLTF
jgi:hypothetical protein